MHVPPTRPFGSASSTSCWTSTAAGVDTAAILLVAAGDNVDRIRNEAASAMLGGLAPIAANSGNATAATDSTPAANAKRTMATRASC